LEAAITQSTMLPPSAFLNLNISAALLEDPSRLAYLIWRAKSRSIVLEITEHDQIDDYDRLRQNLSELGAPVRIAVDDAGAGFASLRHILELRPDFIKLDLGLVAGIDLDPVRQGLVAGLQHFAAAAGASIIAEGIETIGERNAVSALGVDLGQGYLLGKPRAVSDLGRSAEERGLVSRSFVQRARIGVPAAPVFARLSEATREPASPEPTRAGGRTMGRGARADDADLGSQIAALMDAAHPDAIGDDRGRLGADEPMPRVASIGRRTQPQPRVGAP